MDDYEDPRVRRMRRGSIGDAVEYKKPKPPLRTVWVTAVLALKTCSCCSEPVEGQDVLLVGNLLLVEDHTTAALVLCKPCVQRIARCAGPVPEGTK